MTYQLVALDMDGTLLDGAKRVLPSSTEAIGEALAAGRHVAICSGRCPAMVEVSRDELAGIRYAICGSGTSLFETASLEFSPAEANKGTGMLALAELLGVPREATIAVGDADCRCCATRASAWRWATPTSAFGRRPTSWWPTTTTAASPRRFAPICWEAGARSPDAAQAPQREAYAAESGSCAVSRDAAATTARHPLSCCRRRRHKEEDPWNTSSWQ